MENLAEQFLVEYKTHLQQFSTVVKAVEHLQNKVKELLDERKKEEPIYKVEYLQKKIQEHMLRELEMEKTISDLKRIISFV